MKSSRLPALRRTLLLFVFGGACYNLIEILWRGYTHWSMFFLGGVCFQWGGLIARRFRRHCLAVRCVLCSAAVTVSEFLCGCLVNLRFHLHVWDYSNQPFNLLGQICLLYSFLWGLLSIPAMPLYTALQRSLKRPGLMPSRRRAALRTASQPV